VVARAAQIVDQYSVLITLRQLFYRLVAEGVLPNREYTYKRLSEVTAEARRDGTFPALADLTRGIAMPPSWTSPSDALADLAEQYRRERTEGQRCTVVLGVEKRGMVEQLSTWFGDDLGVPIVALAGYDSESHLDEVRDLIDGQDRLAVLLYAGDFDPSGEDILRDYVERSHCFDKIVHVALTDDQVGAFGLPENPGKITDSRGARSRQSMGGSCKSSLTRSIRTVCDSSTRTLLTSSGTRPSTSVSAPKSARSNQTCSPSLRNGHGEWASAGWPPLVALAYHRASAARHVTRAT
jgi:hypothetical protein